MIMSYKSNPNSIKSLAETMDLSVCTISRVLSGQARKYRISEKTEEAVLAKAAQLDYTPDLTAKSLRLKKTKTLGLIVPDISNQFFSTLARHVELEARKGGYSIILCDSGKSTLTEIESLQLLNSRNVDGIIISPVGQVGSHFEALYKKGMPIVIVDRYFSKMKIPCVTSDNYKASVEAVSYLIENGHKKIACIQALQDCSLNMDRVNGYRDALKAHHIEVDESLIVGNEFDEHNGYIEAKLLLKRNPRPTAIFSVGSSITFGAIRAINEEGLTVPEDISILSFDEQPYFAYLNPPLTAVAQENALMGEISVKLLLAQLDTGNINKPDYVVLPAKLNIRKSVKRIRS